MKNIDKDAQELIKKYIDNIEEHLQKNTKVHPNEIDGLLNEINDFLHLRSREISTNSENQVRYNDVLKAIEECGSPSEISQQYLEQNIISTERQYDPKNRLLFQLKYHQKMRKSIKGVPEEKTKQKEGKKGFFNYIISEYKKVPFFSIYRSSFLFFYSVVLIGIINLRLIPESWIWSPYYYYDAILISSYYIEWVIDNIMNTITISVIIASFGELILINKWKLKLREKSGFNKSIDDSLILWFSRIFLLVIVLKTSLFLKPIFIIYVPIWILLMIIIERQFNSSFWNSTLGPWFFNIGSKLAYSDDDRKRFTLTSLWSYMKNKLTWEEGTVILFTISILCLSFLWPWIYLTPVGITFNGNTFEGYELRPQNLGSNEINFLAIVITSIILILRVYFRSKLETAEFKRKYTIFSGDLNILIWIIRILLLRSLLIIISYRSLIGIELIGFLVLLTLLIINEIMFETFTGDLLKLGVASIFIKLGGIEAPSVSALSLSPMVKEKFNKTTYKTLVTPSIQEINIEKSFKKINSSDEIQKLNEKPKYQVVEDKISEQRQSSFIAKYFRILMNSIFQILLGTFVIIKSIVLAILLFLFSIYEVILVVLVITTSFTIQGYFEIPNISFDISSIGGDILLLGGYVIWNWHALLFLGIQLFTITLLDLYGVIRKKPEGGGVKIARVLSFILLIGLIAGNSYFALGENDIYAQLRVLISLILLIFGIATYWKTQIERKHWKAKDDNLMIVKQANEKIIAN